MTESRPVTVKDIEKYLPHRPPMVWIDQVLDFSEKSGRCRLTVKPDALYMDENGLRSTSCIEFIAQAYGFISVCHHIYILDPESKPLSKAFLASIKNAKLPTDSELAKVKVGDELDVLIEGVRQMGPIVMFKGHILHNGVELCTAAMKVFKEYSQ